MSGVVTTKLRLNNALQFFEAFSEDAPTNIYLFIGRPWTWDDENNPPTPEDVVEETDYNIWGRMMALKKVTASDVSYASDRYNWTSGSVYAQWESNNDQVWGNNYFVFTDDFNVYKCLFNNSGANSTVKPTGTSNSTITTGDGYIWKFMYTITAAQATKFLTVNYVPAQTLTADNSTTQWEVQQSAGNGAIEAVDVTSGGSSYDGDIDTAQGGNSTTITLATGASSTDDIYVGSEIYITSGTGVGQKKEIVDYVGSTKVATVDSTFSTPPDSSSAYNVGPKVVINGDGSGWEGYATVSGSSVDKVVVTSRGQNYAFADVSLTSNNGSGAVAHAHLPQLGGHGSDPVSELAAFNVMLNVKMTGSESNTFPTNNDFRVLGLISDPQLASNSAVANGDVYDQTTRLALVSDSGSFTKDEVVDGGTSGAWGYVVEYTGNTLYLAGGNGVFTNTEIVTGNTSSVTATINGITDPDLLLYSGDILYKENRAPITRSTDQIEDIKVVIRF